jgi:hypothetical protein
MYLPLCQAVSTVYWAHLPTVVFAGSPSFGSQSHRGVVALSRSHGPTYLPSHSPVRPGRSGALGVYYVDMPRPPKPIGFEGLGQEGLGGSLSVFLFHPLDYVGKVRRFVEDDCRGFKRARFASDQVSLKA